jgi:hypothetical protein
MQITPEDREFLLREIDALALRASSAELQQRYRELAAAVDSGQVPEPLRESLGRVLSLSLETGRLRQLHGPHAEMRALRLFHQTPQGQALLAQVDSVNRALEALRGQVLQEIRFFQTGPSCHELALDTDRCHLRIVIGRSGVELRTMELGL